MRNSLVLLLFLSFPVIAVQAQVCDNPTIDCEEPGGLLTLGPSCGNSTLQGNTVVVGNSSNSEVYVKGRLFSGGPFDASTASTPNCGTGTFSVPSSVYTRMAGVCTISATFHCTDGQPTAGVNPVSVVFDAPVPFAAAPGDGDVIAGVVSFDGMNTGDATDATAVYYADPDMIQCFAFQNSLWSARAWDLSCIVSYLC